MIEWVECEQCGFLFFPDKPMKKLCYTCECASCATDGMKEADVITVLEGIK